MKKTFLLFFLYSLVTLKAQEKEIVANTNAFQVDYTYSNLVAKKGIEHLSTNATQGVFLSWNKQTFGEKKWQERYNYPDIGFSFSYVNFNNDILKELYSLFAHYNFYLSDRQAKNKLVLGVGTGIAYNTNPYNKVTNYKNLALGNHLNSTTFLKLFYQRENILSNLGIQAGIVLVHASNASLKSPNKGVNTFGFNIGANYNLNNKPITFISYPNKEKKIRETIHFNLSLLGGANQPDLIGAAVYPFFNISSFIDKKINSKSILQLGAELHLHYYLKEFIKYKNIFTGDITNTDYEDWKRVSVFLGHELVFNKSALITQLGFYIYSPYKGNGILYERVGIKRYIKKSYFASISVKAHFLNAEALELGIGYRF